MNMNSETSKQNMTTEKPSQPERPELNDLVVEKDVTGGAKMSDIPIVKYVDKPS